MSINTDLALTKTLQDYCDTRDAVIEKMKAAHAIINDADELLETVYRYGLAGDSKIKNSMEEIIKEIDRDMWRTAFELTGFMQIMDAEAKKQFDSQVQGNPPPFTMETVRSTFLQKMQDADLMFARGIVNVFRSLSDDYKSNSDEPFKINRKAVIGWMFESNWSGGLRIRYNSSERLNDIDRVLQTLDNKKHQPRALETAVNGVYAKTRNAVFEDEFYKIRGFKNGNMHIEFKRQDLLDKANKIIGEYYQGNALAQGGYSTKQRNSHGNVAHTGI